MPLVLFSGLAADGNVFAPQKLAFPQLFVPAWQKPEPNDTLNSYCERLAGIIPSEVIRSSEVLRLVVSLRFMSRSIANPRP